MAGYVASTGPRMTVVYRLGPFKVKGWAQDARVIMIDRAQYDSGVYRRAQKNVRAGVRMPGC
jgi:hypothetical protein